MSVFDLDLDQSQADWAYTLGTRFIEAAQSCGWTCDRTFVNDGISVEAPPPNPYCECQLAVRVTPGVEARNQDCLPVFTAEVIVTVDLCVLVADQNSILRPADIEARAVENQRALWQIMQGLLDARSAGAIAGVGGSLTPGPWEAVSQSGGSARWQTRWLYRQ